MIYPKHPLGELIDKGGGVIRTGPFGSQLHQSDYSDDPAATPVVMPRDMENGRVSLRGISRIGAEKARELAQHRLAVGDTVLGRRGDIGRCAWIGPEQDGYLCGTGSMRISVGNGPLHPKFAYFALLTDECRLWLKGQAVGATMPNLNADIVRGLPIPCPPLCVQIAVADVLTVFDELIDNGRRRIELLEEAARSLYREWFIRFRFPGNESIDLAAGPLGPLPPGWRAETLGGIANWLSGGTPSTSVADYWHGTIPWITSGSLNSFLLDRSERTITEAGVEAGSRLVERNTVLFVVRGMSLAKEFRHGIADRPLAFGQDCKALVATEGVDPLFLAFAVDALSSEIHGMVEYAAHGTGKLSTDRLKALRVPLPDAQAQAEFSQAITPIRDLMSTLRSQLDVVVAARDLLLPRLVSGNAAVDSLGVDEVFGWAGSAGVPGS